MEEIMLKIDNVSKQYKLGQIGGTTLREELQRRRAKRRGEEDPTKKIGAKDYTEGETFMALNGVSFEVKKGERVGIIGHNGAGKSTLLKLISRVTAPTEGTISMNGRVASMLEVGTGFHGELTGRENIYMNGAILGMTKKEIDSKIEDIIEFSECRQFIDTPVKRYSSGMYVKLAFSVAAHLDSEIMIMDEVLAVGDMAFQKKCLDKMNDVSKNEGRTILYVSHNMNTIRQLCDRVIVLDRGKVIFDGIVEEGICCYLGLISMVRDTDASVDYSKFPIAKWIKFPRIKMQNASYVNKTISSFLSGEKMMIKLKWKNISNVSNLCMRIEIRDKERKPIGTAIINDFYSGENDAEVEANVEVNISALVAESYSTKYTFYVKDAFGNFEVSECVDGLCFTITDQPEMVWDSKMFGVVQFPNIVINKVVEL